MGIRQHREEGTALDLLEREDLELRSLFRQLDQVRGSEAVEDRATYGNLAKQVVRHVATREAALVNVVQALQDVPSLGDLISQFERTTSDRREMIDEVEHMSRGVQGINLNSGQDFDAELTKLVAVIKRDSEWDLAEGIPELRASSDPDVQEHLFHSAKHVKRHAPTNLSPRGPRWFERAPLISRFVTVYDHLRDFPRAVETPQGQRPSSSAPNASGRPPVTHPQPGA